jgi:hypothetical protein
MTIDDVDFWETVFESSGCAVYAAYSPYAEFYLIKTPPKGHLLIGQWAPFETYYGQGAMHRVIRRMKELEVPTHLTKYWVDPQDLWLYQSPASN